jgi:predicted GNAT family acetyltransferase
MDLQVVNVPERQRYEARRDGVALGVVGYEQTDEQIVLTHTEVDPSAEGQGIGGQLVRGVLDDVRAQGLAVQPVCPFVQGWMERHPEYADLRH